MSIRFKTMSMAAVVVAGIAAIATGCGGGGDPASGSGSGNTVTAPPSKAAFVKEANAACSHARAGLATKEAEFERRRGGRKPRPGADMVHFVYLPTMESQIWRIEELGVPHGEERRVEELLYTEQHAIDSVAVMQFASQPLAERHFAKADKLFRAYGLGSCTTGGES